MLKFFRDQKDSWFVKGILILTALSFMSLFGIQGMSELSQRNKAVIRVGDHKILTQELLNNFEQKVNTLRKMTGGNFSVQDAVNHGMLLQTLNEMASRAVMEETINQLNLTVSPDAVRSIILNMPMFFGVDGNFSRSMFNDYLQNTSKSESQFVSEMFLDLKATQLIDGAKTATVVPKEFAEMAYQIHGEKRSADLFRISQKDIKVTEKPTRTDLEKLYEEMSEDLIAPEYRDISIMSLTMDDVKGQIQISEEELKELYDENKAAYTIEEIRDVDQMLFDTEEEANKAYEAVKKGKGFMQVAKEMARQTTEQTKLGEISPSTATGEWVDPVFSAKKGAVIAPVQTSFGWQVLRVNSIKPKIEKKFSEVRKEIEAKAKDSMAYDRMLELSTALDDRLGAGENLEDVAKSAGLKIKKYTKTDSLGMNESGKEVDISKNALSVAFISEPKYVTPMIEDGNSFFVLRVDAVQEPKMKTFEQARKEVTTAWTEQKQKEKARDTVKKIETDLQKKQRPADIARKYPGVKYERLTEVTRSAVELPTPAAYALFSKNSGEIINATAPSGYIVARITKISAADPKKDVLGVTEMRRQMEEERANEKANTLLAAFGESLNLRIDENAVKQAFSYLTKTTAEEEY